MTNIVVANSSEGKRQISVGLSEEKVRFLDRPITLVLKWKFEFSCVSMYFKNETNCFKFLRCKLVVVVASFYQLQQNRRGPFGSKDLRLFSYLSFIPFPIYFFQLASSKLVEEKMKL